MKRVARFEKVSRARFEADWQKVFGREAGAVYDAISLPVRATAGSAGYDFKAPCDITLPPGTSVCIPTGIRVWIEEGWTLMLYPRSGLGVRYRLQLNNTVGIIDSDYYHADNEGHIFVKLREHERALCAIELVYLGDVSVEVVFGHITVADHLEENV